jgi:hypothetical protein
MEPCGESSPLEDMPGECGLFSIATPEGKPSLPNVTLLGIVMSVMWGTLW